jgi:hypothetical protein
VHGAQPWTQTLARATAENVLFNLGRGVGGFGPYVIGLLAATYSFEVAIALLAAILIDLVATAFLIPERRGARWTDRHPGSDKIPQSGFLTIDLINLFLLYSILVEARATRYIVRLGAHRRSRSWNPRPARRACHFHWRFLSRSPSSRRALGGLEAVR